MATIKQKRLAKVIVENATASKPLNAGQMLEKVGYSGNLVKQPGRVIEAVGVQEELAELGFDVDSAKKVVKSILEKGKEENRLKAADMILKTFGSYAPEKHLNVNITSEPSEKIKELAKRLQENA